MPDDLLKNIPVASREPHYEFLDPARLRLWRSESGRLRLCIEGDRCYTDVKVVRAFPLSAPDLFIGFLDGGDKVIGLVPQMGELDADSLALAQEALRRHYFVPIITSVRSMREEFGALYFDVETDRGPREFVCKGLRDAMEHLGDGEVLFPDVDGNRYRIRDWEALDLRSRRLLERVI